MGRPRSLDALTKPLSARIRNQQDWWLRRVADEKFDGELGRALRWALDQAQVFDVILHEADPVAALDEMLNPRDPVHPEEEVLQAEREFELWKREQAVKRAQRRAEESQ